MTDNSPVTGINIIKAFRVNHAGLVNAQAVFEHGQWWIFDSQTGAQWSVGPGDGPGTVDGWDFEKITEGTDPDD